MNFRLKTSKLAGETLKNLSSSTGLTWNVLSRIAVAMSLNDPTPPPPVQDKNGVDISRNTMTGEFDYIYKAMITQHEGKSITEDEYFPNLFNAHLERGIKLLNSEYNLAGNYEKLLTNLFKM